MRHAKAEPFAPSDHARALTDRGRVEAAGAGAHLAAAGLRPDYVVVSPATRTVQTWEVVAEAADCDVDETVDEALYHGNPDAVLESLRLAPPDAEVVLFIGHNPTASYLCHLLDDGEGEARALEGLLRGFPTGALAVFDVADPWADLAYESGRLVGFYSS